MMESLHDYSYQCVQCDVWHDSDQISLGIFPDDSCPACDVKYKWDYLSTLTQYKIGIGK